MGFISILSCAYKFSWLNTRDLVARVATKAVSSTILSSHQPRTTKTAGHSHIVTSGTAQAYLNRFQRRFTQTSPVSQRYHMFLSTRVHDHTRQISSRFAWQCARLVAHRHGPHVLHVLVLFTRIVVFHLNSPSVGVRTLFRLTHLVQMPSCKFHSDENNQVFDGRFVNINSICRWCCGFYRFYRYPCHCCSRGISHVACTSS